MGKRATHITCTSSMLCALKLQMYSSREHF